jgi:CHRD domain
MGIAKKARGRIAAAAVASGVVAAGALALAGVGAGASTLAVAGGSGTSTVGYSFTTLDNQRDVTFNQLLGINDQGVIAGYFGSGAQGHPNQGYQLLPPYGQGNYASENFPGSVQTQVTGLNNRGVTVGFWSTMNTASMMNNNFGFYAAGGQFHQVNFPTGSPAAPPVDQLLGVNDSDVAVGFYTDAQGNNHGYEYNINDRQFSRVTDPNLPGASLTAAAINDQGDMAGFYTTSGGVTDGFLKTSGGHFTDLAVSGASATNALGVNGRDEVVGTYTVGSGSSAVMHGFTWTSRHGFTTVDDPNGAGTTTINGVNDRGDLVGFYVDSAGNTDGFLAAPARVMVTTIHLSLQAMPAGSVVVFRDEGNNVSVKVAGFGFTPGSSHLVDLVQGGRVLTQFNRPVIADGTGQLQVGGTILSSTFGGAIPAGSQVAVLNGTAGDATSAEPIAETGPIVSDNATYQLHSVEAGYGTPRGTAAISYNPATQAISVTVNASGLTPGAHAAHIHDGSCMSQGAVQYMLMDFMANGQGQIVNQTRTVTGVTSPIPATGWYLNLHQGNSNNILANGMPTINFRPLLCADI